MTGAAIVLVLASLGLMLTGYMWGLAPLALGLAVLILFDGDSEGGGA